VDLLRKNTAKETRFSAFVKKFWFLIKKTRSNDVLNSVGGEEKTRFL